MDIARENLSIGTNVVLVAPSSRELKSKALFDHRQLKLPSDTAIQVVWVTLSEASAKERIKIRGNALDDYKLANWDEYAKRRFEPSSQDYPQLKIFDNSHFDAQAFEDLLVALIG